MPKNDEFAQKLCFFDEKISFWEKFKNFKKIEKFEFFAKKREKSHSGLRRLGLRQPFQGLQAAHPPYPNGILQCFLQNSLSSSRRGGIDFTTNIYNRAGAKIRFVKCHRKWAQTKANRFPDQMWGRS